MNIKHEFLSTWIISSLLNIFVIAVVVHFNDLAWEKEIIDHGLARYNPITAKFEYKTAKEALIDELSKNKGENSP